MNERKEPPIWNEIRIAVRSLAKSPGFTITVLATLALGIGVNTAIFSAINALLLNPSGISQPDRLIAIRTRYEKLNLQSINISPPTFLDVLGRKDVFETAAISTRIDANFDSGGLPERLRVRAVTWQWFDVFGAKPLFGRAFHAEDDQPGRNRVVILDYTLWQRLYGGDPSTVGKTMVLNQAPFEVIGIMGPEFSHDDQLTAPGADVWVPLGLAPDAYIPDNRFNESFVGVARLNPGVSIEQARALMEVLTGRVHQDAQRGVYAQTSGWSVVVRPYTEWTADDALPAMFILLGTVVFVLLIACSNIAGLMIVRTSRRSRELAVRAALGASRWTLLRQTLTEALVLVLAGTVLGLGAGVLAVQTLIALAPPNLTANLQIHLDAAVLGFTCLAGILSGLFFSMAPAWQIIRRDMSETLKESGRSGTAGHKGMRLQSLIAAVEVALALVLLVGAGLAIRSLSQLQKVDLGFEREGLMTGVVSLPETRYAQAEQRLAFYRTTAEGLARLPGTDSVAIVMPLPLLGGSSGSFAIENRSASAANEPHAFLRWVSPDYFATLGVPLKVGRLVTDMDIIGSEPVVVIDENLARQYWPNESPIGKRLRQGDDGPWRTIVGVAGHVSHIEEDPSDIAAASGEGMLYIPMYQAPQPSAALLIRTTRNPAGLSDPIREVVREIDASLPVYDLRTMEQRIDASLGPRRFVVVLLSLFAVVAVFMAALGLYGVISYGVGQRTREIGIRMALGAQRRQVLALIVGEGLRLTLAGLIAGMFAASSLARLLSSQLFEVSPTDPATFGLVSAILVLISLVASYLPARRAARVDPLVACRHE